MYADGCVSGERHKHLLPDMHACMHTQLCMHVHTIIYIYIKKTYINFIYTRGQPCKPVGNFGGKLNQKHIAVYTGRTKRQTEGLTQCMISYFLFHELLMSLRTWARGERFSLSFVDKVREIWRNRSLHNVQAEFGSLRYM